MKKSNFHRLRMRMNRIYCLMIEQRSTYGIFSRSTHVKFDLTINSRYEKSDMQWIMGI